LKPVLRLGFGESLGVVQVDPPVKTIVGLVVMIIKLRLELRIWLCDHESVKESQTVYEKSETSHMRAGPSSTTLGPDGESQADLD